MSVTTAFGKSRTFPPVPDCVKFDRITGLDKLKSELTFHIVIDVSLFISRISVLLLSYKSFAAIGQKVFDVSENF